MSSTLMEPYKKLDVTGVIDYGDVMTFCPELTSTLALHPDPSRPSWLSGPELENRLCITGMSGQTMHITAFMVDGMTVSPYTHRYPVDPKALLHNDAEGHM